MRKEEMDKRIEEIKNLVIAGKHREIQPAIQKVVDDDVDLDALISEMIAGMDVVGQRFAKSEIFVPEMLVSAKTMQLGLSVLKPLLKDQGATARGKVVLCTVKGDLHDIGKNLVGMMLEGAGFEVVDLGVDVTVEKVCDKIGELSPNVLGLSALLTTTMPGMEDVIRELKTKGLREKVKIMIGGAPIDSKFAADIGADAYGKDAAEAVQIARSFVRKA
jgi:5-methyltetrahydrofolate--homocysteine methyltransferase